LDALEAGGAVAGVAGQPGDAGEAAPADAPVVKAEAGHGALPPPVLRAPTLAEVGSKPCTHSRLYRFSGLKHCRLPEENAEICADHPVA